MRCIGLTGGIGSGKSAAGEMLSRRGAVVIDADLVAREIVGTGQPALAEIATRFGPGVIAADGALDRPALASIVFNDPAALADLNEITHPRVRARIREMQDAADAGAVIVHESALLQQSGGHLRLELIVVVDCPDDIRLHRLITQRGMDPGDARARIASQSSREALLEAADVVLDNSGDHEALEVQIDALWTRLTDPF